jgi:hypothetical protein
VRGARFKEALGHKRQAPACVLEMFSGVGSCDGAFVERAIFLRDPLHRTGADTALARRLENAFSGDACYLLFAMSLCKSRLGH